MGFSERFRRTTPIQDTNQPQAAKILPESVRFALTHGEGFLLSQEIVHVFMAGHGDLGFYLAMKAASSSDNMQRNLLMRLAELKFDPSQITIEDAREAVNSLRRQEIEFAGSLSAMKIRQTIGVQAGKLAATSKAGFEGWSASFGPVLEAIFSENPDTQLYVMANAPYIAIQSLAEHTIQQGRPLNIIRPDRFDHPDQLIGWRITPTASGVQIDGLPNHFDRPRHAVILDDTENTGTKRTAAMNFWNREGQHRPARFVTVRKTHH